MRNSGTQSNWLMLSAAVAAGGGLGALLRFGAETTVNFPFATLIVNILGCFGLGTVLARQQHSPVSELWFVFWSTGIFGALTTFSAFSWDIIRLWQGGEHFVAALYVAGNVIPGVLMVMLAFLIFRPTERSN